MLRSFKMCLNGKLIKLINSVTFLKNMYVTLCF